MGRGYDYRIVTLIDYKTMVVQEEYWRLLEFPVSASECAGYAPASRSATECSKVA